MKTPEKKMPKDANELAFEVVRVSTEPQGESSEISAYLSKIGRRGGLKGGVARAKILSPRKRSQIARKAARHRWGSKKP